MTAPQQPRQLTYAEALVAAAALQTALPEAQATTAVFQLAEQTIRTVETVAAWAFGQIEPLWTPVNPYDGNAVQAFTEQAADVMETAQTAVARAAGAAQTRQLAVMGIDAPVAPSNPLDVRRMDIDADGAPIERPARATVQYSDGDRQRIDLDQDATTVGIFNRPARTYRYLESKGVDVETARAEALGRMQRLVEDNLMLAQRLAESEVLAGAATVDDSIVGLRRVIHPELSRTGTCGLCIAASDQIYRVRDLKPIHGRCKCTVAAVLADFDPADILNKADLKAVYGAAGSTASTDLKRVRFQLDDHGELGPVLVPQRRNKGGKDYQAPYVRRARQLARADKNNPQRPRQTI